MKYVPLFILLGTNKTYKTKLISNSNLTVHFPVQKYNHFMSLVSNRWTTHVISNKTLIMSSFMMPTGDGVTYSLTKGPQGHQI